MSPLETPQPKSAWLSDDSSTCTSTQDHFHQQVKASLSFSGYKINKFIFQNTTYSNPLFHQKFSQFHHSDVILDNKWTVKLKMSTNVWRPVEDHYKTVSISRQMDIQIFSFLMSVSAQKSSISRTSLNI